MPSPRTLRWLDSGSYDVTLARDLLRSAEAFVGQSEDADPTARDALIERLGGRRVLLITTRTAWALHGEPFDTVANAAGADVKLSIEPISEGDKSIDAVLRICAAAYEHRLGRRDMIVAFGGGVCCDLVSVAAALYRRGIDYVCLPTTLVGQIDAGIGIKGAVNFMGQKSRLGTFHPPVAVFSDPNWLATLPQDALRSGMAEIVKVAIMRDAALFEIVEQVGADLIRSAFQEPADAALEVLGRAVEGMLAELQLDPFERHSYRRKMDFGHTYSPWLEEASGFRLTHGQAVAVDMALFCEIAAQAGILDPSEASRVHILLDALGLPLTTRWCRPEGVPDSVVTASAHRGGALEMPVPTQIGQAMFLSDASVIADDVVKAAIDSLQTRGLRVA